MTKVDFYGIETSDEQAFIAYCCRLVNKAYRRKHQILIRAQNEQQANAIDEALWQLDASSFIAHNMLGEGPQKAPAVQISYSDDCQHHHDILLNLATEVPSYYGRFKRILEVVLTGDEPSLAASRERFKFYKDRGHPLDYHKQNV